MIVVVIPVEKPLYPVVWSSVYLVRWWQSSILSAQPCPQQKLSRRPHGTDSHSHSTGQDSDLHPHRQLTYHRPVLYVCYTTPAIYRPLALQ
jgi:hypothetical protein